eukprot:c1_g1_i1 orf=113-352(+)
MRYPTKGHEAKKEADPKTEPLSENSALPVEHTRKVFLHSLSKNNRTPHSTDGQSIPHPKSTLLRIMTLHKIYSFFLLNG